MTGNKSQYKMLKGHIEFHDLLQEIQTLRIKQEKESIENIVSLTRLTKTITNMIRANPEILNKLVDVEIKDV